MNAGSRRRDFGVGVKLVDDFSCPGLYLARLWMEAVIEIYADKLVLFGEHEADAIVATLFVSCHRLRIASPCIGVCAAGPAACERGVRDLGRLAITLFRAPTHPLPQISHVYLCVYCHVKVLRCGEDAKPSPLLVPLRAGGR